MDLTTQPYSADTIVPARSIAEASSTCSGNVADVSAVVADLDPSLAGASCFACNVPSSTTSWGSMQWLSASCVCPGSGCNGDALTALSTAFDWTLPQGGGAAVDVSAPCDHRGR